ncbi:DNA polymerase zeta catalytic subunit [Caerostris extrusa]|uniref:DNA polymerase zeta catalytic subunit n=1 Tax=Caerostris extrusa TaxID=172846 RepID=A0AAV4XCM3_CAEEX|nr:DNA polymerase zeta catalytic subunit [Caerostris extrusa]
MPFLEIKQMTLACELKLAIEIEKCLNSRLNSSTRHHVYNISTVKRKSIYGYHPEDKGFLRIFLYSPHDVQKLANLLNNGTIFDRFIQPYDAHISYVAQFMIDYNLYGMNFLDLSKFEFRPTTAFYSTSSCTLPFSYSSSLPESSSVNRVWDIKRLTSSYFNSWQKRFTSELELDCTADSILNKFDGASSIGKNPGIVAIWKDEMQRRKRTIENFQITPVPTEAGTQDKEILDILFGLCSKDNSTLEIKNNSINGDGDEDEDDDKVTHEMSQTCDDNWTSQQSDHMDEFIENSCKFKKKSAYPKWMVHLMMIK